jgi:hypothetical protein
MTPALLLSSVVPNDLFRGIVMVRCVVLRLGNLTIVEGADLVVRNVMEV